MTMRCICHHVWWEKFIWILILIWPLKSIQIMSYSVAKKKAGTGCHHSEWQWQDKVTPSSFLMRDVHLNLLFKGPLRSLQIMFTDAPVNDRSNWRSCYANDVGCKHWTVKHIVQRTCFVSFVTENVSPENFQMTGLSQLGRENGVCAPSGWIRYVFYSEVIFWIYYTPFLISMTPPDVGHFHKSTW